MIDLQDADQVQKELNLTLDDIWEEFIWLKYAQPFDIVRCVSISVPSLEAKISEGVGRKEFISINLVFEHSNFTRLLMEFKGKGESIINYDPGNLFAS